MFTTRKIVSVLALAAFVTGGAATAAGTAAAAAAPSDREVGITSTALVDGGTDPHLIQVASDPDSSMSGSLSPDGTRIWF